MTASTAASGRKPACASKPDGRARSSPCVALPAALIERARGRRVVEVAAGTSFSVALELARVAAEVTVTDVDARVLAAPSPLRALVHDLTRDPPAALGAADLVVAVRIPEELQLAAARCADALGADLALRPLKDEWADLGPRRGTMLGDGWRLYRRSPE